MSSELHPPELFPAPDDRRAVWWSWPLIALSIFSIGWSVNFLPLQSGEAREDAGEEYADASELALLKIQSQVVIAAKSVSPKDAAETLAELKKTSHGDRMIASIALLESFIAPSESDAKTTLRGMSEEAPESLRALTSKAITEGVDEAERSQLADELGWFSDLAPSLDLASPPEAAAIQTKAMVFLVIAVGLFGGALIAVIAGGILLVTMLHRQKVHGNVSRFRPDLVPRGVMLECFALYLGIMAGGELAGMYVHSGFSMASYALAVIVPFLWPLVRRIGWGRFSRSLGFHTGAGFWKEMGAGAVGYLGVVAIASIGIFLTILLGFVVEFLSASSGGNAGGEGGPVAPTTHPIVGWIYSGGVKERLLCLFLAAGFAPFFEEIFFRGALHRFLRGRFRFFVSALLTGVIFASLHPQGWMGIPALAAIGIGFSLLREWRDSLIAPMVAHAINNGVLVTMLWIAL